MPPRKRRSRASKPTKNSSAASAQADKASAPIEHAIGYRQPPLASRFKKGKSGNPRGRPKGSKNLRTEIKILLNKKFGKADGLARNMTGRELVAWQLFQRAAKLGDAKALQLLMSIDDSDSAASQGMNDLLSAALDPTILDDFKESVLGNKKAATKRTKGGKRGK